MILDHPADRILFGTDSPWADQSAELARWRALGLPENLVADAFGGNAERLLQQNPDLAGRRPRPPATKG